MRSNQKNNRSRGRGNNSNNNNRNKNANPLTRNYDSNGPDIRVRGSAAHVAEKYMQLARDANSSGDSVAAENFLQHAEHYFRIISAAQAQQLAQQQAQQATQEAQQAARAEQQAQRQQNHNTETSGDTGAEQSVDDGNIGATAEVSSQDNAPVPQSERPQKAQKDRAPRERRPRRRPVAEKSVAEKPSTEKPSIENPVTDKSADAVGHDNIETSETPSDPAGAPQPDVNELPAFVTAEADNSAAE